MKILNYIALVCLLLVIGSMFLPVYKSWILDPKLIDRSTIGIVNIYKNGDTGYLVVHNGFGSFYAIFASVLSLLLGVGIFRFPKSISIPIVAVSFYGFNLILLGMSNFIPVIFRDQLVEGFYVSLIGNAILITISFYKTYQISRN